MDKQRFQEGYAAGLNKDNLKPFDISCPYDGRTRQGRSWWKGFMVGDAERCAQKLAAKEVHP